MSKGVHRDDGSVQVEAELKALEARPGTAEVVVVGTGYAGMELATTVAERLGSKGQVRMVTAGKPPTTSWLHSAGGHAAAGHLHQGWTDREYSSNLMCKPAAASAVFEAAMVRSICIIRISFHAPVVSIKYCAGKEILEGCPAGQKEAGRKALQEQSVPVVTEAMVTRVELTESQPASTSQPARKRITLKTPTTDSHARASLSRTLITDCTLITEEAVKAVTAIDDHIFCLAYPTRALLLNLEHAADGLICNFSCQGLQAQHCW